MTHAVSVLVHTADDIVTARQRGRELASSAGFSNSQATIIAAAISEVARNIVEYASSGEVAIGLETDGQRTGVQVVATDCGPGISDPRALLSAPVSTGDEAGLGIPGARSLMDEFDLASRVGYGTTVTMTKWRA